jgi:hypothetical protein
MFSTGWKIAIQTISSKILLYYFKSGVIIFLILSMDIVIYNINEKSYNKYCEVINIIFVIIISIIILKKIKATVKLLYKKLYYYHLSNSKYNFISDTYIFTCNICFHLLKIY